MTNEVFNLKARREREKALKQVHARQKVQAVQSLQQLGLFFPNEELNVHTAVEYLNSILMNVTA